MASASFMTAFDGGDFFQNNEYDDDNQLLTDAGVDAQNFAKKTVTGTVSSGSTIQMHDYDSTTFFYLTQTGTDFQPNIVYDLLSKKKIKSVEVDASAWETGGAASGKLSVDYSDDNSTWTNAYLSAGASTETRRQASVGDFRARYVRVSCDKNNAANAGYLKVYGVVISV